MDAHQSSPRNHFFEVVEWSEQLRPVTSVWLGAVLRSVQVRLCTSGCKSEKMFGIIIIINGNPQLVVQLPPQSTTHKTLGVMINKDVSGKLALPQFQFQCDGKNYHYYYYYYHYYS